uniref:Uncharacterized protein n=1 Tax=Rhizophora mucronata TaxID=61149 RepID=A0A2P2PWQ6_RHIMU
MSLGKMTLKMDTISIVSSSMNHTFPSASTFWDAPMTTEPNLQLWLAKGSTRSCLHC